MGGSVLDRIDIKRIYKLLINGKYKIIDLATNPNEYYGYKNIHYVCWDLWALK